MKQKFFKVITVMVGFILSACSDTTDNEDPAVEYGIPQAKFILSGSVVDETGTAIEGIQVSYNDLAVSSDENGEWTINGTTYYSPEYDLSVEDIDGTENGGEFNSQTIDLTLSQTVESSGGFDQGTYEEHDIDITLIEKD